MLSSKEIKDFFDYINKKTEGETLAEKTFLAYKDFIINYSNNSILAEIIKQLYFIKKTCLMMILNIFFQ